MPEHIISDRLPKPAGAYSHVVVSGSTVWTAGFGPVDPRTGGKPEGIAAQTHAAIDKLELALQAVGLQLHDVVKVTAHLQYLHEDFAAFDGVYAMRFAEPRPVRTTVGAQLPGILVEVDAVAVRPS